MARAIPDDVWFSMSTRSGVLPDMQPPPIAVAGPSIPAWQSTAGDSARSVEQRVAATEFSSSEVYAYNGPRSDLTAGRGARVIVGDQGGGLYGIRIYNSAGVLVYDLTA